MNIIKKILYNKFIFSIFHPIYVDIYYYIVVPILYPHIKHRMSKYNIYGKLYTAKILVNSNKSLGRFGDGELQWMLGNKVGSFEKNSPLLSYKLSQVIKSTDKNFMVALPDAFRSINQFNKRSKRLWGKFVVKYAKKISPYLSTNKYYFNTSVVRPYMDYCNYNYAKRVFSLLKRIWSNRNILIIEGKGTRLGVGNDLFQNSKSIKRIECPVNNAFESYDNILKTILVYISQYKSKNFLILISLGPTATVLSYDLSNRGYRSLDIGHIDTEYMWYKMNVKEPVNISYKYTNETSEKEPTNNINDQKYFDEIVTIVK